MNDGETDHVEGDKVCDGDADGIAEGDGIPSVGDLVGKPIGDDVGEPVGVTPVHPFPCCTTCTLFICQSRHI